MKKHYFFLLSFAMLLLGIAPDSYGAGCSGQFTIVYPSGNTTARANINNGTTLPTTSYCPTNSNGTADITVSVESVSIITITQGGVTVASHTFTDAEATASTPFTFTLPVSSSTPFVINSTLTECTNPKNNSASLTLAPSLSITSSAGGSTVCPNTPVRLTATGATNGATYTLRSNGQDLASTGIFDVTPTASTTYTVATNVAACGSGLVTQQIRVATSNIVVTSDDADNNVSKGQPVTLTITQGSGPFTWTSYDGITTMGPFAAPAQITVSPIRTTQYTATGTSAGGCASQVSIIISVNGAVLPVELTSFTAALSAKGPVLNWVTASEKNSDYFSIERSFDSQNFQAIGRSAGAGTTSRQTTYQFIDQSLEQTTGRVAYYRLRQVDVTGEESYSPVRAVQLAAGTAFKASAFPNPYTGKLSVRVDAVEAGTATLVFRDVLGKALFTQRVSVTAGIQDIKLAPAAALPAGIYYLTIQQGRQQQVLKVSHQ
jgi:hypothetical protein